jgi:REP element-mobilizing transposase RayT
VADPLSSGNFPVKYRKAHLHLEVTKNIQETMIRITERYPMGLKAIAIGKNNSHVHCSAHPIVAWSKGKATLSSVDAKKANPPISLGWYIPSSLNRWRKKPLTKKSQGMGRAEMRICSDVCRIVN